MKIKKSINGLPFILTMLVMASILTLGFSGCSVASTTTVATTPKVTTTPAVTSSSAASTTPVTTTPKVTTTAAATSSNALATTPAITTTSPAGTGTPITIKGYITSEDDFAAKLGADTAAMIHMRMMAASGLGITRQKTDGTWEFYFFNGNISSGDKVNGAWTFSGTGPQLDAWNIVTNVANEAPQASVPVTVVGVLKGDTRTNPGMDADGLLFPVITVTSITPN